MRRRWAACLALFAWLGVGLPAYAVVLRYAPKVGVVTKHKVTVSGRAETTAEDVGRTMRVEISGTVNYHEKALSETPDRVRIETAVTGGKLTMKMGGSTQAQEVPTGRMVAEMDRRGRLVKIIESDLGQGQAGQSLMGPGSESWSNLTNFAAFPEGDVRVGDVWSDEISIPAAEGQPEIKLKLTSRLLALPEVGQRKCAKIRTNFSGPLAFAGSGESDAGAMQATLQGDVVWLYDYQNSVYVSGEGKLGMDMKMNMSAPEMPGMDMSMKMLMNVKLALAK
jgi:hypothetical protein